MEPHSKISYTAILCARSLAENTLIPYAKEIWQELKNLGYNEKPITFQITNFLAKYIKSLGLLHLYLEGRYLAINSTLEKLNFPTTIEIASGMTPRALNYKKEIIETDLSNIIKIKQKILEKITKIEVKIISLNILDKKSLMNLGNKIKNKNHVALTHTGLWTYLSKEEQNKMAENIREFLKKHSKRGYWISADFQPKSIQKNFLFKYFRNQISKKTKRNPNRFNSEKEILKFMQAHGFKVRKIFNKEIIKNMKTIKKFKLKKSEVLKQGNNFKVYIMTLR